MKIEEKVMKKINKKWSNKSQIGYSELAMIDAIKETIEQIKNGTRK